MPPVNAADKYAAADLPARVDDVARQPTVDRVGHPLEPLIADPFAVEACHVVAGVAHDVVDGYLVAGFPTDGLERMPEGVEAQLVSLQPKALQ